MQSWAVLLLSGGRSRSVRGGFRSPTEVYAADAEQLEYPNRLVPPGAARDRAAIIEGFVRGKQVMREQHLELHEVIASGEAADYECTWTPSNATSRCDTFCSVTSARR